MLKIKRAYEKKEASDGKRILIDRLWPRGVTKADAGIDEWLKDLGPSTELRKWFAHDPAKWAEFKKKYLNELASIDKKKLLEQIVSEAGHGSVTLIYSARDSEHSDVKVLEELISEMMRKGHA